MVRRKLDTAYIEIDADTRKAIAGMARLTKSMQVFGRRAIGTLGLSVGVGAVLQFGRTSIQAADDVLAASENAGLAAERFQTLGFAFEQSDVKLREYEDGTGHRWQR